MENVGFKKNTCLLSTDKWAKPATLFERIRNFNFFGPFDKPVQKF